MYHYARFSLSFCTFVTILTVEAAANSTSSKCLCGYYDANTGNVWTESIIVYFNETTTTLSPHFIEDSYTHKFEKGWNTQFRAGASPSNVNFSNPSSATDASRSLELYVSPYNSGHLVLGSGVRTSRRDIQYGSFTALLRSPAEYAGGGGSVLTLAVEYNSTQSISTNLQNKNEPSTASISTLANKESLDTSAISYGTLTNGSNGFGMLSPWNYTEYRLEWKKDEVKYFVGRKMVRLISRTQNKGLLSVPAPLYIRHWSNGLATGSQGPPKQSTVANVGAVRLFFNSSLMTGNDHASFARRCRPSMACLTADTTLRGSSTYSNNSMEEWKQASMSRPRKLVAIWLAVACISLTASLLLSPIWTRLRERLDAAKEAGMTPQERRESMPLAHSRAESPAGLAIDFTPHNQPAKSSIGSTTLAGTDWSSPTAASFNASISSSPSGKRESNPTFRRRSAYPVDRVSSGDETHVEDQNASEQKPPGQQNSPEIPSLVKKSARSASVDQFDFAKDKIEGGKEQEVKLSPVEEAGTINDRPILWSNVGWKEGENSADLAPSPKSPKATETSSASPELSDRNSRVNSISREAFPSLLEGQQQIDYLAGLLVISCLLVTAINFNLTFVYGDLIADNFLHSNSEGAARKTISPFLLNQIWIGPFLLTSARFLVANYLRTEDLLAIAEKAVKRTFRLMLPVMAMVMLEYFFIECDATKWLEYLPSITWSTWPFVKGYSNFSNFLSEILELIYLIPNAAPVISFNYCTHVLWTIPVQLQGSWTALLVIVIIREINSPWKRFGFYAFCIVNHWYALSWGSYFYFGIMLTDLDVTYKCPLYLHARPLIYYPVLLLCITFAFAGPTMDLLSQRTGIDYAAYEYGIHPNATSGLQIPVAGYPASPAYFSPRLNGLVFAVGLQTAVGLSPAIQKVLSSKLMMLVFPHVFTIYLLHGFIFWTFGSWLCIFLATRGLSYWSNILAVGLCCYTVLALSTPLVTPILHCLGKTLPVDVWRQAREEPAPRRPTLHPFPKDLFLNRCEISWQRKPSKDVDLDEQVRKFSRAIPRHRKPSKDLRSSWYDSENSVSPRTTWHERQGSADSSLHSQETRVLRPIPHDRRSSKDLRISWHERKPSISPRSSWYEMESSAASKAPSQGQGPSADPGTAWHERKSSQDFRTSWYERKASKAKLERVETVEEEPEV